MNATDLQGITTVEEATALVQRVDKEIDASLLLAKRYDAALTALEDSSVLPPSFKEAEGQIYRDNLARTETEIQRLTHVRVQAVLLLSNLVTSSDAPGASAFERASDPNAFARASDPNSAAFGIAGILGAVGAVSEVVGLADQIGKVVVPLLGGFEKVPSKSASAFDRADNPIATSSTPAKFYQDLLTAPALALIKSEEAPTPASAASKESASEFGLSLGLSFFQAAEDANEPLNREEKTGSLPCVTQSSDVTAALVVGGINKDQTIHLWEDNTILKWRMIDDTFDSQKDFTAAESAMFASTAAWNKIAPGGVRFERAASEDEASFQVVYSDRGDGALAIAFFPAEYTRKYSTVEVTATGLSDKNIGVLSNVMCHELGHVLGFRHSFALEKETSTQAGLFGNVDPNSVMSYMYPPKIDVHDVNDSRKAYEKFQGGGSFDLDDGNGNLLKFKVTRVDATS